MLGAGNSWGVSAVRVSGSIGCLEFVRPGYSLLMIVVVITKIRMVIMIGDSSNYD